jgi:hypothetical protein
MAISSTVITEIITETLDIIVEILIMLLLDGLQCLGSKWTLICVLQVPDEHGT